MVAARKKNYIDAVRGWAIILVITCHVGGMFPELPFPVKKLTNFGWHGVQLFFLASAVTLLMSWNNRSNPAATSIPTFFKHRFFRIAPMYYLGVAIYYVAEPPRQGLDLAQLSRSLIFVNAWSPDWIPTTPGWMVVPGGWSIGVEFSFYAIFPLLASLVTSLRRACLLVLFSMLAACACNQLGAAELINYPPVARYNFLYFWFPNQFPIFSLGIVLYYLIVKAAGPAWPQRATYGLAGAVACAVILLAERPSRIGIFLVANPAPTILLTTVCFMVLIYALARGPDTLISHPIVRRIGTLSFSAYVLHFLFVRHLPQWTGHLIDVHARGLYAISQCALLWALALPATMAAASIAHVIVERPGMKLGRTPVFAWPTRSAAAGVASRFTSPEPGSLLPRNTAARHSPPPA